MRVLAADIGNTETVFGIFDDGRQISTLRLSTHRYGTSDEWHAALLPMLRHQPQAAGVAGVVPSAVAAIRSAVPDIPVYELSSGSETELRYAYPGRLTLGADRVANALGALKYYADNCIIADFGTAITFCLITDRTYRGGVIAPGIHTAMNALNIKTARLPAVSLSDRKTVLGSDTYSSIESGMYFGFRGLTLEIINGIRAEAGTDDIRLIATGGIVESLAYIPEIFDIIDRNLTLKGVHTFVLSKLAA